MNPFRNIKQWLRAIQAYRPRRIYMPAEATRRWQVLDGGGLVQVAIIRAATRSEAMEHPKVTQCNNGIVRPL